MAQNPHEYLIEQLQFTGDESVGSSSNKIRLNLNHPVKELVWVVQPDKNVDYCGSLECNSLLYKILGAQPFNYTDAVDALPNALHAFAGPQSIGASASDYIGVSGLFYDAGAADVTASAYWNYSVAGGEQAFIDGAAPGAAGSTVAPGAADPTSSVSDAGYLCGQDHLQ